MRWTPHSLVGRVFALYAGTLALVLAGGLALFLTQQFQGQVEAARDDARILLSMLGPVVSDSAVIGDYDAIQRQIGHAARHTGVNAVFFVDAKGATLQAHAQVAAGGAPALLVDWLAARLVDMVQPVQAGGADYGSLKLQFAAAAIAQALWHDTVFALALAAGALALGMLLIRQPLVRWLGHLDRIGELDAQLAGGSALARQALATDAPIEFRRTFEVLGRAANSLQAQREQAAATLAAIDEAVFTCGLSGQVSLANEAACRLLGREPTQIHGQSLMALVPALAGAVGVGQALHGRWQHRTLLWTGPDGQQRVLDTNLTPIIAADGLAAGHVLACRDVTDQHKTDQHLREVNAARAAALASMRQVLEHSPLVDGPQAGPDDIKVVSQLVAALVQRLHERTEQLDAIFALSPDGFASFDAQRTVRYASPQFCALSGLSKDMVLGLEEEVLLFRLQMHCPERHAIASMAQLRQGGAPAGNRHLLTFTQPQHRVLELALHEGRSGVVSQVLQLRDVTRDTEVERLKSEFLATAAHELRTPMTSIYGFIELLILRDPPPEKRQGMLQRVRRQSQVMIELIEQLLDLSRLESGKGVEFDLRDTDLGQVLREALSSFEVPSHRVPPVLHWPDMPRPVQADARALQQALRNVLSNAYKYSPEGGDVEISAVHRTGPRGEPQHGVAMRDHGIGMTPAQLQRVGERFYRADATGSIPGTGLGIGLVQEIVRRHGGELLLASTAGEGTTATLWLPAAVRADPPTALPTSPITQASPG